MEDVVEDRFDELPEIALEPQVLGEVERHHPVKGQPREVREGRIRQSAAYAR